jgi:hypothetical protein
MEANAACDAARDHPGSVTPPEREQESLAATNAHE